MCDGGTKTIQLRIIGVSPEAFVILAVCVLLNSVTALVGLDCGCVYLCICVCKQIVQYVASSVQPVRRMMWTPDSVKTGPLMSPTLRAKEASSNGFCI